LALDGSALLPEMQNTFFMVLHARARQALSSGDDLVRVAAGALLREATEKVTAALHWDLEKSPRLQKIFPASRTVEATILFIEKIRSPSGVLF
jgi:hypothetical protein